MTRFLVAVGVWLAACLPIAACAHAQDAAQDAKVAGYAVQLAACRTMALDAGHLDWAKYQACACEADKSVGVDTDSGCP